MDIIEMIKRLYIGLAMALILKLLYLLLCGCF